jgi:hypothetical protein
LALAYVNGATISNDDKNKLSTYKDHFDQSWPEADKMINCGSYYRCTI